GLGPQPRAVEDAEDLDLLLRCVDAVSDDVTGPFDHKLSGPRTPSLASHLGLLSRQIDSIEDLRRDVHGGLGVVLPDMDDELVQVELCQPRDRDAELHRLAGRFDSSPLISALTSSKSTSLPASASAIPASMAASCRSFSSMKSRNTAPARSDTLRPAASASFSRRAQTCGSMSRGA